MIHLKINLTSNCLRRDIFKNIKHIFKLQLLFGEFILKYSDVHPQKVRSTNHKCNA